MSRTKSWDELDKDIKKHGIGYCVENLFHSGDMPAPHVEKLLFQIKDLMVQFKASVFEIVDES